MLKQDETVQRWIVEAMTKREDPIPDHPSAENLLAFRSNRLPPEEESQVRDHIGLCHQCADLLLFLASRNGGMPYRLRRCAAALRRFPGRAVKRTHDFLSSSVPASRAVLASVLTGITLALPSTLLLLQARNELSVLSEPKASTVIVDVDPGPTRNWPSATGDNGVVVELSPKDDFFILIFPPLPGHCDFYGLRILNSELDAIWTGEDLKVKGEWRQAMVEIPRRFLGQPGRYFLEIRDTAHSLPAEVFSMTLKFGKDV